MIFGIGTDIVSVQRIAELLARYPKSNFSHLLNPREQKEAIKMPSRDHFLAKRFAAKEALSKALGTGLRSPVRFPAIWIEHNDLGKPCFNFESRLADWMQRRSLKSYLSISDELSYVIALVVVEKEETFIT